MNANFYDLRSLAFRQNLLKNEYKEMSKKIETEISSKATENLRPYFTEQERRRKEGFPTLVPSQPQELSFLEPLWGKTPRHVWGQYKEFVIGEIMNPEGTDEKLYNSNRIGVWNAATGELVFKRFGAVSICWNPDYTQIGVWYEYLNPELTKAVSRGDWFWEFERYNWETNALISSCKVSNDGYVWSVYAEFPKKYKGAIARLYCSSEDGGENIFILCDNEQGDRELSYEEMEPLRKLKSFNLKQFWEETRNPKLLPKEPNKPEVTGERKVALTKEVESAFSIYVGNYKYQEIVKWFKNLGEVVDFIILNNLSFPKMAVHVTPQFVFTWKSTRDKDVILKIIFKSKKTVAEFRNNKTGELLKEEYNEANLRDLFAKVAESDK